MYPCYESRYILVQVQLVYAGTAKCSSGEHMYRLTWLSIQVGDNATKIRCSTKTTIGVQLVTVLVNEGRFD